MMGAANSRIGKTWCGELHAGRTTRRELPCVHRGEPLTGMEREAAGLDHAKDWRRCEHESKPLGDAVCPCQGCGPKCVGYVADHPAIFTPVTTRHLLYHLYPLDGPNGVWRWNVEQLCKRMDLFNGRRIVAVAFDPITGRKPDPPQNQGGPSGRQHVRYPCASAADVVDAFGEYADGIEFIHVENDPELCELASFDQLFGRLRDHTAPDEAIFYGHSKGTTHPPGSITRAWTEALYETNLDHWPRVGDLLERFPVVGAFKKVGRGWPSHQSMSRWHYSGSFYWLRNAELYAKPWRKIDRFWSGIEPWPSLHFSEHEAGCVFHERPVMKMNLYDPRYWTRVVRPELERFRAESSPVQSKG